MATFDFLTSYNCIIQELHIPNTYQELHIPKLINNKYSLKQ